MKCKFLKKSIIGFVVLILLFFNITAYAVDIPIDPETITGQRNPQQEALTVRRGVDLFSDTADEITKRLERQREEKLAAAQATLFNEPFKPQVYDPETLIQQSVNEAGLFSAPMRFDHTAQHEVYDSEIPLWVIILVLIIAAALGLLIARKTPSRRRENLS